ncbi:pyridoxal kinase PdxY [Martelella endophytica]|uniref:pyridoxal kinase n=1 Tax=Martelella endophytica TaxID=1486262 RepID=A0A0D5LW20_MAREN|nr:pyridoxal kinase PdxY [Martelella endophytica]AJY47588.1 pyridoxamine kinase [Martelella endophytica]
MIENSEGAVIAISSHVMRGTVGNRAIVFALETLGFATWAVPTVVLPWHPGHGRATRLGFDPEGFAAALSELAASPWRNEVRAVISGYLADARQAEAIAALVTALKADNPELLYLCDPVMGDERGLYVPMETADAIRDLLLPLADIATPNRFELAHLAGTTIADNSAAIAAALALGPAEVVVTSAHSMLKDGVATLFVDARQALLAEHPRLDNAPNGLGDLFSALFAAAVLSGKPRPEALEVATAAVYEALVRAVRTGSDELELERAPESLRAPMAKVGLRQLMHPARRRKRS